MEEAVDHFNSHDKIARETFGMNFVLRLMLLGMSAFSTLTAQQIFAHDSRIEGAWKLRSEKSDGSVVPLPAGSMMMITRDADHILVRITDGDGKVITSAFPDGGPIKLQELFSNDAKTLTQTASGTDSHRRRPYTITRIWGK